MDTHGYEMKAVAVSTYDSNLHGDCDETMLTVGEPEGEADIIVGGPPCQPFSQIGYQRGMRDPRDGFPIFLDAVIVCDPHSNHREREGSSVPQQGLSGASHR